MRPTTGSRHKSYTVHLQSSTSPGRMTPFPDVATAHNRDLALQKYMLLHTEHQSLRQHLDQLRPLVTMISCDTAVSSPAHSPERCSPFSHHNQQLPLYPSASAPRKSSVPVRDMSSSSPAAAFDYQRRGSRLKSALDERTLCQMVDEERQLFDVNECMKRTLTELLNCDDARTDPKFRMWVQRRLMETERELRVERRRRSSAGSDCY